MSARLSGPVSVAAMASHQLLDRFAKFDRPLHDFSDRRVTERFQRFASACPDSFLEKYIPGELPITMEHKPGATDKTAVHHIYSAVNPDGLIIGARGDIGVAVLTFG
jgi:hypothetical protein